MNSKQPKYRIDLLFTENLANRHGILPDHKILIALLKSGGPSRCIGVDAKPHFATTIFVCTVILTVLKIFSIDFLHELKVFS